MGEHLQRSVFTTQDPAEGLAKLDEVYALRDARRVSDGAFSMTLSSAGTGPMTCGRLRLGGPSVAGTAEDAGVLRVGHVLEGTLSSTSGRERVPRRGPFLFPRDPYRSRWEDLDLRTVSLDATEVERHARELLGAESFRLQFTGTVPVTPVMARYWLGTVVHLQRDVLPNDEAMGSPLVRAEAVRSLITALLNTFPSTFLDLPPADDGSSPAPAAIRRAVSFMDAHLDEDVSLAEIAAAARMSVRGLQAAFRRELGSTPLHHLRSARLEAAHRDLVAADPTAGATVEAVAARWGFGHRGRFAALYRERYGQAPSATLRG